MAESSLEMERTGGAVSSGLPRPVSGDMGDTIPTPVFSRVGHGIKMADSDMRSGRYGPRIRDGLHNPDGHCRGPWGSMESIKHPTETRWMSGDITP